MSTIEPYDFVSPATILFGPGRCGAVGSIAARYGHDAWLVTGSRSREACGGVAAIEAGLASAGLGCRVVATSAGEPTVDQVAAALAALPATGREQAVMIAVGGGATIDLAKALAALATNAACTEGDFETVVIDHLEGVGRGLVIGRPPLPLIAVPTTAGTGAEATRNAVISCPRRRFKKSMRSPLMVPRAAIVDPTLTLSCSRETTAASGLDCITQLIESFICRFHRPLPRALVLDALPGAVRALSRVLVAPGDHGARATLAHAALVSGIALTNSGLGMAHGVAAALGIECGTPHGAACALMLPVALRVNRVAAGHELATLERAISGELVDDDMAAVAFIARIEELCVAAGTPRRLRDVGLAHDRLDWVAANSGGASMRGNPRELDAATLREILETVY